MDGDEHNLYKEREQVKTTHACGQVLKGGGHSWCDQPQGGFAGVATKLPAGPGLPPQLF